MAEKSEAKPKVPLTERAHAALLKHGPSTADALARRVRAEARAVSKALSALKRRGRASFRALKSGENVWRALKGAKAESAKAESTKVRAA